MSEPALDTAQLIDLLRTQPDQAVALLRKAAARQDVDAQLLLAQIYAEGRGIAADPAMAMLWYEVAANAGHPEAMNQLGRCHELGFGTACNIVLAALWYRRAAGAGSIGACTTSRIYMARDVAWRRTTRRRWRCTALLPSAGMPNR